MATSPGAFTPEPRNQPQILTDQNVRVHNITQRFVRPPEGAQRRGGVVYSPQPVQQQLLNQQQHQQLLQRQQIIQQQHEGNAQDQGQNAIARGTLQRQQVLQQQQNDISQDGQTAVQRGLQMVQQRQVLQQQQQNDVIPPEGQSIAAQRGLQIVAQRQQIIQQQEGISQDGQTIVAQRSLQMTQQRQQIIQQQQLLQQQQSDNISQEGQNSINQRSLQMVQQRQQILQQQNDVMSPEGQNVTAPRNLQMVQPVQMVQRQQILQQQQQILQQQHENVSQNNSQDGQNSIGQRTLQMAQQRQQILQQQQLQQQEAIPQDSQNIAQRNLQIVQQQRQQILQQQQHDSNVSQGISQDGQNVVAQRTLQMAQRQQILQQQHENISQDGQNAIVQRNLQIAQQRQQQVLQQQQQMQQQHDNVSQDGQSAMTQKLQMVQQRQQILQQQHEGVSHEGQNTIAQRSLQMVQQRQQILHQQQHEGISQEGQTALAQRSLQMAQQRQQILQQQQQHENVPQGISQEGQNSINQRSLQMVQQRQHIIQQQQQQQRQQFLQMQQQQQQKPPSSPMVSQPANSPSPQLHQQMQQGYNQPPNSPMVQQATMGSPMLQQQMNPVSQPPSPMNRISPMLHGGHHHSSTANQPPSSPMMPRSPMVAGSPMQMQRRQSTGNSPAMPDRPQSVENPGTPRTPHTPHSFVQQNANLATSGDPQQMSQQVSQEQSTLSENRGGGNANNPLNPIPFPNPEKSGCFKLGLRGGSSSNQYIPQERISSSEKSTESEEGSVNPVKAIRFPNFGRYGYFKLGLRGGSPMWSTKTETIKSGKGSETSQAKRDQSTEDKMTTTSVNRKPTKIDSLVCADYNDFDDDSHTPPQASPTTLEVKSGGQVSSLAAATLDNGPLTLESPGEKLGQLPDTTDYDDDKTIVNTEVTLSSAAQRDNDDITVIEQFGDSELVDVISGSLEGDMQEEYVLFEPGMVVDLSADSNDSLCHALVNDAGQGHDLVQILEIENPESQSEEPILSDEDLVPSRTRNKKSLRLDIVRTLQSGKKLVTVTDTPDSPDQEELRVDTSSSPYLDQSPDQDLMVSLVSESEVVIIDPTTKSPEDNLSKGSGDDETEKMDSNMQSDISKESTSENLIEDQTKSSKRNKSPTNFVFPEKTSYIKISAATVHQTNIGMATPLKSTISLINASTPSTLAVISASTNSQLNQVGTQLVITETKTGQCDSKGAPSSSFSNQKTVMFPSMASIVADAKIAAKLSQTALENISNFHQCKGGSKTVSTSETLKVLSSGKPFVTASSLSSITESLNKPTKLILSVQPTSVTLSTPKMSIPDLSESENVLKNKDKHGASQESEFNKKTEKEEIQDKIKDDNGTLGNLSQILHK